MTEVLQSVRFKTLLLDISFIVLGCILAIFLSSHILKDNQNIYGLFIFGFSMILYVLFACFLHYKHGYLKLKKFKKALHIMYNTNETSVKIVKKKDKYGYFTKDKIGFIHYDKI